MDPTLLPGEELGVPCHQHHLFIPYHELLPVSRTTKQFLLGSERKG